MWTGYIFLTFESREMVNYVTKVVEVCTQLGECRSTYILTLSCCKNELNLTYLEVAHPSDSLIIRLRRYSEYTIQELRDSRRTQESGPEILDSWALPH